MRVAFFSPQVVDVGYYAAQYRPVASQRAAGDVCANV